MIFIEENGNDIQFIYIVYIHTHILAETYVILCFYIQYIYMIFITENELIVVGCFTQNKHNNEIRREWK